MASRKASGLDDTAAVNGGVVKAKAAPAWRATTVRLGDLKPWPRNPRLIKDRQAERLSESFDEFGQVQSVAVGPDMEVYDGHQRLNVLLEKFGEDYELQALQSSRPLTEKEREKLVVYLHKGAQGAWDFDVLADEFEVEELLDWGFQPFKLGLGDEGLEGLEPEETGEEAGGGGGFGGFFDATNVGGAPLEGASDVAFVLYLAFRDKESLEEAIAILSLGERRVKFPDDTRMASMDGQKYMETWRGTLPQKPRKE